MIISDLFSLRIILLIVQNKFSWYENYPLEKNSSSVFILFSIEKILIEGGDILI